MKISEENAIIAYVLFPYDDEEENPSYKIGDSYFRKGKIELFRNGFGGYEKIIDLFKDNPYHLDDYVVKVKIWGEVDYPEGSDVLFGSNMKLLENVTWKHVFEITDILNKI